LIKQFLFNKLLIVIFLVSLFFNLYQLHKIPFGFHADEVRVGWNAYSLYRTGKDDWGNSFPLYYNTFGDYRPAGIIYSAIPSIFFLEPSEFAVRLPSALIGALSVFPLAILTYLFTKNIRMSLFSSLFLSLSPWWISTSRSTNEVVISTFLTLCSLIILLLALKNKNTKYLLLSFFVIFVSYLFYHSIRLLAPIFVFTIVFYYWKNINTAFKKPLLLFCIAVFFLSTVFLTGKSAQKRFSQVSVIATTRVLSAETQEPLTLLQKPPLLYGVNIIKEYFSYFSGEFLIGDSAKPLRYRTPSVGALTYIEIVLLLTGIAIAIQNKKYRLPLFLLLVSPFAAALTKEDSPNLNRSLLMVPFIMILMGIAATHLIRLRPFLTTICLIGLLINFAYFWRLYTTHSQFLISFWRNGSMNQLVNEIVNQQNSFEKIYITNDPDSPFPWYAFFTKQDPAEFNEQAKKRNEGEWKYKNIVFTQKECPSGDIFPGAKKPPLKENFLVIDGFKCAVGSKINDGMQAKVLKQIKNIDGTTAYTLWVKN